MCVWEATQCQVDFHFGYTGNHLAVADEESDWGQASTKNWPHRFFLTVSLLYFLLLLFRVVCVWLVILIALYHLILARLNWFFLNRRQHPNTDWQNTGRTAWLGALPHLPTHVFSLGFTAMKDAVLRSVVVFNQIIIEIFCRLISWPIFNRGDKKNK